MKLVSKSIALTEPQVELINYLVQAFAGLGIKTSFSSVAQQIFRLGYEGFDEAGLRENPLSLYQGGE